MEQFDDIADGLLLLLGAVVVVLAGAAAILCIAGLLGH
jgi:hypothetical protein